MSDETKLGAGLLLTFILCIGAGLANCHLDRQFKVEAIRLIADKVELKINTKDLKELLK